MANRQTTDHFSEGVPQHRRAGPGKRSMTPEAENTAMSLTAIAPLAEVRPDPAIVALPKADLHVHQEWSMRLDRVLARRERRPPYDWHGWANRTMRENPTGD